MKPINPTQLKQLIEASLFVLAKPLSVNAIKETVLADFSVSRLRIPGSALMNYQLRLSKNRGSAT